MIETSMMTPAPQRMRALERANEVRLERAALKRQIAYGAISAADVILACPKAAQSWPIGELLMSQRRWGVNRCRKFLARNQINEMKRIGTLTERQRRLLAMQLEPPAPAQELPTPAELPPAVPQRGLELVAAAV
jgi:hypothetical protein